jgi:hypothetical protein
VPSWHNDLVIGIHAVLPAPEADFIELSSDDGKARSARQLAERISSRQPVDNSMLSAVRCVTTDASVGVPSIEPAARR